ncbi:lycopene cyclase domain-containing protein [Sulfolobus tengchongensis]|uniref:Lycopene cyclase domain-containing protein n=1 Tax=Sulfolobus tengchongensis TaxID=207809 RepID=A0AAX4KYB2_9CREN
MEITFFLPRFAYLEIDSLIFFPTLLISLVFLRGKRNYLALLKSILLVDPFYLLWDFIATWKDSWSFNPQYVMGIYVIDLPIEEIIFFLVTPFATLTIYDFMRDRIAKNIFIKHSENDRIIKTELILSSLFLLTVGFIILPSHSYTAIDLIYLSSFLLLSSFQNPHIFASKYFWEFMGLTYIPFFIFDFFLTYLPVVIYGPRSILGIRVISIPIEDFIYSFSMIGFYLIFYIYFSEKITS